MTGIKTWISDAKACTYYKGYVVSGYIREGIYDERVYDGYTKCEAIQLWRREFGLQNKHLNLVDYTK
jgi:hypothetical protein